jgi:dipeptidase
VDVDYLWYVPAQEHPAGTTLKLRGSEEIPQVPWTYGYFWDQCPETEYSNALVNEWGIALGSDACSSREDSLEELEKRGDIVDGGIGRRLRFILAERCRTAREAVELAAKLLDHYGYRDSGRNLSIVGPQEAWILQMARGKHYVARKVGDDEAVPIPNAFTIRDVDLNDHFQDSAARREIDMGSASCVFGVMAGLVDVDYKNVIQYVQHQWQPFEAF